MSFSSNCGFGQEWDFLLIHMVIWCVHLHSISLKNLFLNHSEEEGGYSLARHRIFSISISRL